MEVYTISKFKEFQDEFTGKMYCEVLSIEEGSFGMTYEVREDVIFDERVKQKKIQLFLRKSNVILFAVATCLSVWNNLQTFITVLIRNGVRTIPERYILGDGEEM